VAEVVAAVMAGVAVMVGVVMVAAVAAVAAAGVKLIFAALNLCDFAWIFN
jgi:hypothetical protein